MSFALSAPLQEAVFGALSADAALAQLVGDSIFDAPPQGAMPAIHVALGPENVRDASDGTGAGAWHAFVVSVVTEQAGFQAAKQAAGAISDVLHDAELTLTRGRLVGLWFHKARAKRERDGLRRIDLTFRARVQDS